MIITKYDLNIDIEGVFYQVVYSPLNHKNRKKLEKAQASIISKNKEVDVKKKELNYKKEQFVLNAELLKVEKDSKKPELLREQKILKKEIYDLEVEISKMSETITPVSDDIEKMQEEYFDMCISGDDADKLKNVIASSDVNFDKAVQEIEKLAKEESEKK
mgnify:CR=1 FL=1